MNLRCLLLLFLCTLPSAACAEVSLPKIFSSHMVIQRDMPIHIWGNANAGEKVTVSFNGVSASTTADITRRWSV